MSSLQTKKIRIQDFNLSLQDIMLYPAWEYALDEESLDGQDERTVRPYLARPPLNPDDAYLIVRASFVLADGTHFKGMLKPYRLGAPRILSTILPYDLLPTLVTEDGKVEFCYGANKPNYDVIEDNYQKLRKKPSEVFPVKVNSDIDVMNSVTQCELNGFMFFDENSKDFFHLKSTDLIYLR
jgi:hypothetical protein